jgi:hypothetical protein
MARHYRAPFLQVVYNNRGWKAPKYSTLAVYPDGYASRAGDIDVSFDPPPDYAGIAAAPSYAREIGGRSRRCDPRGAARGARGKTIGRAGRLAAAALAACRDRFLKHEAE